MAASWLIAKVLPLVAGTGGPPRKKAPGPRPFLDHGFGWPLLDSLTQRRQPPGDPEKTGVRSPQPATIPPPDRGAGAGTGRRVRNTRHRTRTTPATRWLLFLLAVPVLAVAETGDTSGATGEPVHKAWGWLRDEGFAGAMRFDYFRSSKDLDNATGFFGTTAQARLNPVFNNYLDGKIEARVTNPDVGDHGDTDASLIEAFITTHFAHAQLRVGKQIVAWGRADGINPTDNLTPHDYRVLLPFEEDQRFGTTAIKFDAYLDTEYTLTLFTTPYFLPSKLALPTDGATVIETRPEHRWSNSEVGIKLDKVGDSLDGSVSYYHGFSLLPEFRPLGLTPTGPLLQLRYPEIDVLGADVAHNAGRYGFRAEVAYIRTEDRQGEDPVAPNPYVYVVAGADRTFLDSFSVNLQLVGRWVQYYTRPENIADPLAREAAIQNAITFGQQDRASYGMTSRLSNKWLNDTLEAEVLTFVNFRRSSFYVRPLITYAFTDHFRTTIGGELYSGADDTFFGRYKRNSGPFAELRYSF